MKQNIGLKITVILIAYIIIVSSMFVVSTTNNIVYADNYLDLSINQIRTDIFQPIAIDGNLAKGSLPKKIIFEPMLSEDLETYIAALTNDDIFYVDDENLTPQYVEVMKYDTDTSSYDGIIRLYFNKDYGGFKVSESDNIDGIFFYTNYNSQTTYGDEDLMNLLGYVEEIEGLNFLDFSNVKDFSYTFFQMKKLKYLDLSQSLIGAEPSNLQYMFYGCESLEYITFPADDYFDSVPKCSGMFYGLNNLKYLDLSKCKIDFSREMDTDFAQEEDWDNQQLGTYFITAPKLYNIVLPTIDTANIPQSIASYVLGDFSTPIVNSDNSVSVSETKSTLGSMFDSKAYYRIGYIKYIITIDDVDYTIGTDRYLMSLSYKAKSFTTNQIKEDLALQEDLNLTISGFRSKDNSFYGNMGEILTFETTDNVLSPTAMKYAKESSPLVLNCTFSNVEPEDTTVVEPVEPSPETPVIEELDDDKSRDLTPGEKAGIAAGVVGGAAAATGTAAYFFTGYAEIDGVKKLVLIGKKVKDVKDEFNVLTFRGKKYKIKRKNLKFRRKKKDDDDDDKPKKIKIPIFFLKH